MIQIILLAAGLSRRFGGNKLLSDYYGKPLYRYGLDALRSLCQMRSDCSLVTVTRYEEIAQNCAELSVPVCINERSEDGIASSLHLGLEFAPDADYYLCSVADQPELTAELLDRFLTDFLRSGKGLGCVSYKGQSGNPVIFSCRYRSELMALTGDRGGKVILQRHREDCFFWECPPLQDVDTPEDVLLLQKKFQRNS